MCTHVQSQHLSEVRAGLEYSKSCSKQRVFGLIQHFLNNDALCFEAPFFHAILKWVFYNDLLRNSIIVSLYQLNSLKANGCGVTGQLFPG